MVNSTPRPLYPHERDPYILFVRNTPELLPKTGLYNSSRNVYETVLFSICVLDNFSGVRLHYASELYIPNTMEQSLLKPDRPSDKQKFSEFSGTTLFIAIFTRSRHGTLSQIKAIRTNYFINTVDTTFLSMPRSPKESLSISSC